MQYAPSRGRYKVYLIDEVHMLSKNAFNALLKTLEEPPPHVKFLLATTDPQKIPVTVLSRCLQFNLKRLPESLIAGRITQILDAEQIPYEAPAVQVLAQAADGSLRDGLSLLDQSIAFGGGAVKDAEVRSMLGTIERTHVQALLEALASRNGGLVLRTVAQLDERAPDYELVLDDLASALQRVAVAQAVPAAATEFDDAEVITALAKRLDPADVQLFYQMAVLGKRDLGLAPSARSGFEMTMLRMLAFQPMDGTPAVIAGSSGQAVAPQAIGSQSAAPEPVAPTASAAPVTAMKWREPDWGTLAESLGLKGAAQQLAANCVYRRREGNMVHLEISAAHQQMITSQSQGRLEEALSRHFGEPLKVKVQLGEGALATPARLGEQREADKLAAAKDVIAADPLMRQLGETFGTQINPDLVKPAD